MRRIDRKSSMVKKKQITNVLAKNMRTIRKFGVRKIGLFGSVVKGRTRTKRDIDILVEFNEKSERFNNLINLYFFLQELLGKKIDLVTAKSISPYIAPYILKEVEYIEELS